MVKWEGGAIYSRNSRLLGWWRGGAKPGVRRTPDTLHGTHKDAHVLEDKMRRDGCDGNPRRGESRAGGTKAARSHMLWWWREKCGERCTQTQWNTRVKTTWGWPAARLKVATWSFYEERGWGWREPPTLVRERRERGHTLLFEVGGTGFFCLSSWVCLTSK